ncbi:hypothetical protein ATK30_7101 [Amycolatopsis echigonensis]|uniref:Uncharacterized protein n=1 Tax=Amycolatopsis echigonensis TaxID=2576905 RepID=A0A2N3WQL5_9PSEU|nr:hypothetical protein ATK30_7101 [Amycolatopsis niigatensis]
MTWTDKRCLKTDSACQLFGGFINAAAESRTGTDAVAGWESRAH